MLSPYLQGASLTASALTADPFGQLPQAKNRHLDRSPVPRFTRAQTRPNASRCVQMRPDPSRCVISTGAAFRASPALTHVQTRPDTPRRVQNRHLDRSPVPRFTRAQTRPNASRCVQMRPDPSRCVISTGAAFRASPASRPVQMRHLDRSPVPRFTRAQTRPDTPKRVQTRPDASSRPERSAVERPPHSPLPLQPIAIPSHPSKNLKSS